MGFFVRRRIRIAPANVYSIVTHYPWSLLVHHLFRSLMLSLCLIPLLAASLHADLRAYVDMKDDSYDVKFISNHDIGTTKVITVQMTSQTWRGINWTHWLSIIVPQKLEHTDKAVLHITGGNNNNTPPNANSSTAKILVSLANQTGTIMVVVQQVPNQPLFGGRHEDALIAMTFAKYLETQEADWPLLLPMVKSAVRAMDATQALAKERLKLDIKQFVVTGASKRGWTTWLTAAVDKRVIAIAPMVIDVLNFDPQLEHQRKSYGQLSDEVRDYSELKLDEALKTPRGKNLAKLVDPYSYIDKITIPKLVMLGTNDPYWTVDASSFYFNDLKGGRNLYYEPNAGHGLGAGIYPTLLAFFDASMRGKTLPQLDWKKPAPGQLTVTWDTAGQGKAAIATLWQARSPNRDFRQARWTSTVLTGEGTATVKVDKPDQGWTAFYVSVRFPHEAGLPFAVSTEMSVIPETFPNHAAPKKTK